jgi:LmbE family N-acetylglucosaminyl deacetylase
MSARLTVGGLGTVLGIWAHPDDEAYLSAGLMAEARRVGHRVVVVTATRGEQGTDDPHTWPSGRLARHRELELAESLRAIGVEEHTWLGYADGSLAAADRAAGVAMIAGVMDDVAPDTVVTFGPEGMTGHDDHRTISSWVTEAWQRREGPTALWYATQTPEFHAAWGELNEQVGLWFEGSERPVTPPHELAAQIVCTGPLIDVKYRALRAHASQTRPLEDLVGSETYRRWWSTESFVAVERGAEWVSRTSAAADRGRSGSSSARRPGRRLPASG